MKKKLFGFICAFIFAFGPLLLTETAEARRGGRGRHGRGWGRRGGRGWGRGGVGFSIGFGSGGWRRPYYNYPYWNRDVVYVDSDDNNVSNKDLRRQLRISKNYLDTLQDQLEDASGSEYRRIRKEMKKVKRSIRNISNKL